MKSTSEVTKTLFSPLARLGMLCLIFAAASCSKSDDAQPSSAIKIKLSTSSTLGNYLTDGDGNALYFFSTDVAGQNTCTGGCATAWPIFFQDGLTAEMLGTGLTLSDFGTITVAAGQQLTYKGWPLYYYAPNGTREPANQTTGEAVGGVWFVAKTDYTIMLAKTQLVGLDGNNYKGDYTVGEGAVTFFTDAEGRTIYTFTVDRKNKNNVTTGDGAHDANWPIYTVTLASVPSVLDKTLFGTIDVSGVKQLTYKGWPLYYFGHDAKRGDTKGVSVPSPGVWPVGIKDAVDAPEN